MTNLHDRTRAVARALFARPFLVDTAIAAVIVTVTLLTATAGRDGRPIGAIATATALIAGGALMLRRRFPFPTLLVSALAAEVFLAHQDARHASLMLAAPLVALATVAEIAPRTHAVLIGGLIVLSIGIVHVFLKPEILGAENLALAAFGGLAVAAGTASRHRHAFLAEARARADQAEADREAEARRRVMEERLRIARDLHDVVGHQLALIHIQARVAAHALSGIEAGPAGVGVGAGSEGVGVGVGGVRRGVVEARAALDHVCAASKAALTDFGDTIGLLRQPGDPADPTVPVGGLDRIDALLTGYRRSGLDIAVSVTGPARPVAGAADLTAYRVVQESLTNVCKHAGPTSVTIDLAFQPEALVVAVENRSTGQRPDGLGAASAGLAGSVGLAGSAGGAGSAGLAGSVGGHGQVGMRERVEAVGGTFAAGPVEGGGAYRVTARLPLTVPVAA